MKIKKIKLIYIALLISSIAITTLGLLNLSKPLNSLFDSAGFLNFIYVLFGSFFLILSLSKIFNINQFIVFIALLIALIYFTNNILPFIAVIYFLISAYAVGRIINKLICKNIKFESVFYCVVGLGVFGTLTGLLAHAKISNDFIYWIFLTAPIIWMLKYNDIKNIEFKFNYKLKNNYQLLFIYSIIIFYVTISLMPEIGYDALAMHFFIPGHMKYRGMWGFDVDKYAFAVMPMLGDWLYSILFIIGNETSLRLFNVALLVLISLIIRQIILLVEKNEKYSLWAILFFISSPLAFTETSSLFIDNVICLFVVSSFAISLKIITLENNEPENITFLGLLIAFCIATKSTGFLYSFSIIFMLFIFSSKWLKECTSKYIFKSLLLITLIGSIPYINAYYISGNPLFPFYNGFFKSNSYVLANFDNPIYRSNITFSTLYELTFHSNKYLESTPGSGGFILLLLLIPMFSLLFIKKNIILLSLLIGAFISFFSIFYFQSYLRYIYPVYGLLYAYISISFSIIENHSKFLYKTTIIVASLAILLNLLFLNAGANYKDFPLQIIFDSNLKIDYLQKTAPIRLAVDYLNKKEDILDSPVLVLSNPMVGGLKTDALYPIWYNYQLQNKMISADTPEKMTQLIEQTGAKYIVVDSSWDPYWAPAFWGSKSVTNLVTTITRPMKIFGTVSIRTLGNDQVEQ
jgi:hypothetical protein